MRLKIFTLIGFIFITLLNITQPENSYADLHSFTGLPLTEDGWTDILAIYQDQYKYRDCRIIYVSASGNDNTARAYKPGNPVIGSNPFNPSRKVAAYATLRAAYAQLRDGYPDIMLLKRGDTWEKSFPRWNKSGRSNEERMILGAYGPISENRPKVSFFGTYYGGNHPRHAFSYNIIVSIEFGSFKREIGGTRMLIEDCAMLKREGSGMTLQGYGEKLTNSALRRVVISERYPDSQNSSHCQGLYITRTENVLIEECFFDHNGWTDNPREGGGATIYNHNTYLSARNSNTIMRYNISSRSSSKGFQPGGGGIIYGNLSFKDPIGIESSRDEKYNQGIASYIKSNVILSPEDSKSSSITNWGLRLCNVGESVVEDNIFAENNTPVNCYPIIIDPRRRYGEQMYVRNVTIKDNIIYNYGGNIYIPDKYVENISIKNNKIHQDGSIYLLNNRGDNSSEIISADNTFYSGNSTDAWFRFNGRYMSLDDWKKRVGDVSSTVGEVIPQKEYTISAYLKSINESEQLNIFYKKIQNHRKGNWDKRYTAIEIINFVRSAFGKGPINYSR